MAAPPAPPPRGPSPAAARTAWTPARWAPACSALSTRSAARPPPPPAARPAAGTAPCPRARAARGGAAPHARRPPRGPRSSHRYLASSTSARTLAPKRLGERGRGLVCVLLLCSLFCIDRDQQCTLFLDYNLINPCTRTLGPASTTVDARRSRVPSSRSFASRTIHGLRTRRVSYPSTETCLNSHRPLRLHTDHGDTDS